MDLSRLSQGERIVLIAGVLLIIDLLFFPWHRIDVSGAANLGFDTTRTAVQSPNGGYGVVALILAVVMVTQIAVAKLTSVQLPDPPVPWSQVHVVAGIAVAVLLLLKLIQETDFLGFGSYLGVLAGLAVGYGGYAIAQERGRRV